ncbi:MAG: glycoside hydrolase family 3 N-terminal domain-containing protein [Pseudomonadota bacterium]
MLGVSGTTLSAEERAFFSAADPWGFILFRRNLADADEIRRLTGDLRETVGRDAPILIDQEGGRVARLAPPLARGWAPVLDICAGPRVQAPEGEILSALRARHRIIADDLRALGIDADCLPVLDVPQPGAHPVIGARALGQTGREVALRGREVMTALLEGGVLPVVKHMPGHGRAGADSHDALPVVDADRDALAEDFLPFTALRDAPMGMTAHVVYTALDPERCATLSPAVIALIRGEIGFDGLLMTDDLSMAALTGPIRERGEAALAAGCDVLLHCNGEMAEMAAVAEAAPILSGPAARRAEAALAARRAPRPFDRGAADARYTALTGDTGEGAHAR